ncbi:protein disabled isoform X2 [Anopheles aquasalis]|uniref:protein disabled isoform X2 n=1 Tax=Anopheles aquasalis TaxID=42839 RepID=UPI00215A6D3D|nr:protein disabled isoform X2 [Anopheles aquasalis]
MQTIRKKTSPLKYRNEPGRFFGDGVSFKAKLIGILEVGEARGDRMCQEALQDLKMAIRAAGEHKQRITIHVTIDGLRLRDEKTGDSLYHHPVHKISFIAQDMTDSRAFGYIFGSPDSGHRFFGIKTDKAASQVVLAMRDLFQVVFELKKKEIELARQHIQSKITAHEHQAASSATLMSTKTSSAMDGGGSYGKNHSSDPLGVLAGASGSGSGGASSSSRDTGAGSSKGMGGMGTLGKSEKSPESVADLVDLEQELSCIQRGITQMERITPSEGPGKSVIDDDPFGDSFANIPPAYNLLPPPESSKRHQKQANNRSTENLPKASETSPVVVSSSPPPVAAPPVPSSAASYESAASTTPGGVSSSAQAAAASTATAAAATTVPNVSSNNSNSQPTSRHTPLLSTSQSSAQNDDWLNSPPNTSRFDPDPVRYSDEPKLAEDSPKVQPTGSAAQPSSYTDVFTDLDPLGTGKIKPYIDKKYFFQELKNPPKKVLKDLSGKDTATFNANFANEDHPLGGGGPASMLNASNISTLASGSGELFKANFEEAQAKMHAAEPPPMATSDDGLSSSSKQQQQQHSTTLETSLGASGSGSASKNVDLFQEDEDFSKLQLDPFEVHFSRNASPRPSGPTQRGAEHRSSDGGDENVGEGGLASGNRGEEEPSDTMGKAGVYNGPLQVNLPPESWASYISQKRLERQTSEANNAQQMVGMGGGAGAGGSMARNRPAASSVFKQNTVDVISSLSSSSKKMKPNLFGQKFSKRDSNSINMRRLQESDSLSETETAPEPPPRPDSASHIEPPPLPPKKQFADIVIRPSPRSSSHSAGGGGGSSSFADRGSAGGGGGGQRYDYVGSKYDSSTNRSSPQATGGGPASDAPPLPLPSRKVGRTSSAAADTIGPGRPPHRKSNEEEDYLTPIAGKPDIPTLLPPPQRKDGSKTSRSNTRKQSETDPRNLDEPTPPPTSKSPLASVFSKEQALHSHSKQHQPLGPGASSSSFLPDITLSQLLTLGIDELAAKLGVPVSKLSTMTLVELTSYLSEFIENSKQPSTGPMDAGYPGDTGAGGRDGSVSESPVFKVNFDDSNEFVAKFDDNFGEDDDQQQHRAAVQRSSGPSFVANFDELNMQSSTAPRGGFTASSQSQPSAPSAPSTSVIDKYAVFREIMDQDTGGEAGASSAGGGDSDREQEQQTGASGAHGRLDLQAEVTTEMNRLSPAFAGEGLSPSATGGGTAFGLLGSTGSAAPLPMTKIDTKITEVISQAKDRYAALRDIILVEDLFEKPAPMARAESSSFEERDVELDDAKFEANFDDMIEVVGGGTGDSPGINISDVSEPSNVELDDVTMPVIEGSGMALSGSFARISNATPREDLEIDELMQQAVSNLSLHTNDQHQLSSQQGPNSQSQSLTVKGSPMQVAHSSTSPYRPPTSTSTTLLNDMIGPQGSGGRSPAYTPEGMNLGPPGKAGGGGGTVIDTSTSPIPLGPKQGMAAARSPILKPSSGDLQKSGSGGGGMKKKPTPAPRGTGGQSSSEKRSSGSVSDGDDETSPEGDNIEGGKRSRNTPTNSNESWAVFDQPEPPLPPHSSKRQELRHESRHETARRGDKNGPDSPCSSDPKDEWTKAADLREYGRRWPSKGGHTSSSSRDVSPWDEEGPDFRKRHQLHGSQSSQPPLPPSHHHQQQQQQHHHHHHPTSGERYHHPRMPPRRINSNDEDYEDELMKEQQQRGMRRRGMKGGVGSRSRDNFDDEHWYHDHHHATTWSSPTEDDESRAHAGSRSFDRNAYERSTYGPPYEKREPKSLPPYDRRDYKSYADGGKRKYYREREQSRGRSSYDYDPYAGGDGGYGGGGGRGRVDYEDTYGCRGDAREAREYFYDRERKSFDRESNESYDSRERRSGFGSGDLYGSLDSRAEYREQRDRDRDRYLSLDKGRSLRRGMRNAGSARLDQELDQDSEGDLMGGGGMMGGRSSTGGGGIRGPDGGVNSLHRSSQNIGRMGGGKHGHGGPQQQQQMLMDDDVWGVAAKGAGAPWKRPSSATEQDRRYDGGGGGRRSGPSVGVGSSNPIGSDGEKDRRFRKKSRSRTSVGDRKDLELRSSNYATMRYPLRPKEDYFDFDAVEGSGGGGGGPGHGSGRRNSAGMAALDDDDDDDEEDEEEEEDDGGGRPSGASRTTGGGGMLMDDSLDDSPAYYGRRQAPPQSSSGYYGKSSSLASRHAEQAGGRGGLMNPAEALIAQEAKKMSRYEYEEEAQRRMKKSNSRDLYFEGPERGYGGSVTPPKATAPSSGGSKHHQAPTGGGRMEFEFDEFGDSLAPSGGGKFSAGNYDPPGDGFESDFNSPPTMGAATTGSSSMVTGGGQPKSYRFSNDFSIEKDRGGHYGGQEHPSGQGHYHRHAPSHHQYKSGGTAGYGSDSVGTEYSHQSATTPPPPPPPPTSAPSSGSKLRFNENVTVSKFDAEATTMFEDDFAGRGSDVEQDLGGESQQQQQQGGWPSSHSTSPGPAAALRASPAGTGASGPTSNNGSNKKILKTSSQPSYHHTQHSQQYHQQQQQQHHHQKQYHQDNIRKSDSINIFAKKVDDPFEDDDFFSSQGAERDPFGGGGAGSHDPSGAPLDKAQPSSAGGVGGASAGTGWDKNFANFDDNI